MSLTYYILAPLFFITIIGCFIWCSFFIYVRLSNNLRIQNIWLKHSRKINLIGFLWLALYAAFILFLTGPQNLNQYPPQNISPYKLPWKAGVSRFVAQGNRSFTSHRKYHEYAWDFLMPNGTPILAARSGHVAEIQDQFDGIGINSNFISIEHEDGTRAVYAHIQKNGTLVLIGAHVHQGDVIAYSGMVGQTIFPHVHFYVVDASGHASMPISFNEVMNENSQTGVPLAGRFYTSQNTEQAPVVKK